MDWVHVGIVVGIIGIILAAWPICKYIMDRRKVFGKGNRILKIERKKIGPDRFEVSIKNENSVKEIGIDKVTIKNRNGNITELYTIEELDNQTRYIEASGIEIFTMLPSGIDSVTCINAPPCIFSIIDTNGKKDEVELKSMSPGILYEAES